MVAMLLAGGKGTRLEALTKKVAKPAVSYGGKYRIIDFPLSNCANSNLDTVGVLTQYESVFLNTYIGNGEKWGLNGVRSITASLAPRQTEEGAQWYKGTADAIFQNLDFLESLAPQYVLILSGDHIYKMDYQTMLASHQDKGAELTVSVIEVEPSEASRFGIMSTDKEGWITSFEEKPEKPKSTLASMGIYIFNYNLLKQSLIDDSQDASSEHDFGKNIIPKLLKAKRKLLAHHFKGYWRDVGTIRSLWQANMDLLDEKVAQEIFDGNMKIYSENTSSVPHYVGATAAVNQSLVNQGAVILGSVSKSVVFNEVIVEEGAVVTNAVLMPGCVVKVGAVIHNAIVASHVIVAEKRMVDGGKSIALVGQ